MDDLYTGNNLTLQGLFIPDTNPDEAGYKVKFRGENGGKVLPTQTITLEDGESEDRSFDGKRVVGLNLLRLYRGKQQV